MTLNDVERRNSPYFAFFLANSIALLANYVTNSQWLKIGLLCSYTLSPSFSLSVLDITNPPCSAVYMR